MTVVVLVAHKGMCLCRVQFRGGGVSSSWGWADGVLLSSATGVGTVVFQAPIAKTVLVE